MALNYKSFGQGDPIIILHGLFGSLDNWQTIARQLANDYTVFILDQRNHGRSPHYEDFNYEVMSEDVREFMESQWLYGAAVLGHSMGGKTAMQLALNYPDLVNKLMVIDIAPKTYPPGHNAIFDALFSVNLDEVKRRSDADKQLKTKIESVGIRQFLLKNLAHDAEKGYQWKMNLPVIYKNYEEVIKSLNATNTFEHPTLFVRGGQSDYISTSDEPLIKELFPSAIIETIPQAGHWVHADAPDILLNQIYSFLK